MDVKCWIKSHKLYGERVDAHAVDAQLLVAGPRSVEETGELGEHLWGNKKILPTLYRTAAAPQYITNNENKKFPHPQFHYPHFLLRIGQHRFEDTMHLCSLFKLAMIRIPSAAYSTWRGAIFTEDPEDLGISYRGPAVPLMFLSAGSERKSWEKHLCFVSVLALRLCQIVRQTRQLPPYRCKAAAKPLTPSSACPSCLKWCCFRMQAKCVITSLTGLDNADL